MDTSNYQNLSEIGIFELRKMARDIGIKMPVKYRKAELLVVMEQRLKELGAPAPGLSDDSAAPAPPKKRGGRRKKEETAEKPARRGRTAKADEKAKEGKAPAKRGRKPKAAAPEPETTVTAEAEAIPAPKRRGRKPRALIEAEARAAEAARIAEEERARVIPQITAQSAEPAKEYPAQSSEPAKEYQAQSSEPAKEYPAERAERFERVDPNAKFDPNAPEGSGILEIMPDGYGFLRASNFLPGSNDIYISNTQIKRFNLRTGDLISGSLRLPREGEKFGAIMQLKTINGDPAEELARRPHFEGLTPIYPNERLKLESAGCPLASRIIDLAAPIGKGQRGMVVAPPKAGKTVLLKQLASSILKNNPEIHLIVLLIDERPEEVTDMKRSIEGKNADVVYSTFDEQPEHHKRVAEIVLERAKRLVEQGKDLVILVDSITRMARAYNITMPMSGRTLSGGLDPAALYMPKKFFGAARNIEEGGSLTIIATALIDTGSKMDDVIFEEFKGTGNMELVLNRALSEKRVFPAIDIVKSGTRHDEKLLKRKEMDAVLSIKKISSGVPALEFSEKILDMLKKTKNNDEFIGYIENIK
ncbi:MAG: transcription termination factor Rho [Clostridiales bacterium]|jgi:transcription termination factor Rho|nr:transcription termination factor Rho [Clostridiales bacterium]